MEKVLFGEQYEVSEWSYRSSTPYPDPFNDIELDVLVSGPAGGTWRVPAYWAGGSDWRVRFAPPAPGEYTFRSLCSDVANADLHDQMGRLTARPYSGSSPLLQHGALGVSPDRRFFQYADGTPFFWLGDTWWMGLCQRLDWPASFQSLTADRVAKGYSVIQIVAGPPADMDSFDERGMNEGGFPWESEYARINPAYFDMADLRITWLVRSGLMPCILACWGYYLPVMGEHKMKQHWRYLVARWGAYPVIWCLAGEAAMAYYLAADHASGDNAAQIAGWTEIGRYVREIDPFHRLITIHPTQVGRDQVTDDRVLDFNMLQTGHGGLGSVPNTITMLTREQVREPRMPVLVGEVSYEGFMHGTGDETQRLGFWAAMLNGAAGHTYGANGIWQVNLPGAPFGPSPLGATWGNRPWNEAAQLPGSAQLGVGKRLLERYDWQTFQPHPEWVDPCGSPQRYELPFAAGNERVRIIYFFGPNAPWGPRFTVQRLDPAARYKAFFYDPRSGEEHSLGEITPNEHGAWLIPWQPEMTDWVVVLES